MQDTNVTEKKQKIKDLFAHILALNRQKINLSNELNTYFLELKELGFPKAVINKYIKKLSKPRHLVDMEDNLYLEFEAFVEDS